MLDGVENDDSQVRAEPLGDDVRRVRAEIEMRSKIVNQTTFSKALRFEIGRAGHRGLVRILPLLFAAALIAIYVYALTQEHTASLPSMALTAIGVVFLIFFAFYGYVFSTFLAIKKHESEHGDQEITHVNSFSAEGVDVYSMQSAKNKHFELRDLKRIINTKNLIILVMKNNAAIVVHRSGFSKGSAEALCSLLRNSGFGIPGKLENGLLKNSRQGDMNGYELSAVSQRIG